MAHQKTLDATINPTGDSAAPILPSLEAGSGVPGTPIYAEIAIPVSVRGTFTYNVPLKLAHNLSPGHRVLVPFGRRTMTGYCIRSGTDVNPPEGLDSKSKIKDIKEILDEEPILQPNHIPYLKWMSQYYHVPLGQLIAAALPAGINKEGVRGIELTERGTKYLDTLDELPAELAAAVKALKNGPVTEKKLTRRTSKQAVATLLAQDFARVAPIVTNPVVKERTEDVFTARSLDDESLSAMQRRAPVRAALYRHINESGRLGKSAIPDSFKSPGPLLKKMLEDGIVTSEKERIYRDPHLGYLPGSDPPEQLTRAQEEVLVPITEAIDAKEFKPFLLHGITGSGKTEVYLCAIEHALSLGRGALLLVPEIALTPQLLGHLMQRFGETAAVLHSGMSPGERYDEWFRLRSGAAKVGVGVRSAIFAPIENLGVLIVDEEHDGSYKQDDGIAYNARDVAMVRARDDDATVILGSATPSLESYHNALDGKYTLLSLPERVGNRPLPKVSVIDLRDDDDEKKEIR